MCDYEEVTYFLGVHRSEREDAAFEIMFRSAHKKMDDGYELAERRRMMRRRKTR